MSFAALGRLYGQVESHPLEISEHYGVCQDLRSFLGSVLLPYGYI